MNNPHYSRILDPLHTPIDFGNFPLYLPKGQEHKLEQEALESYPCMNPTGKRKYWRKRIAPLGFTVYITGDV